MMKSFALLSTLAALVVLTGCTTPTTTPTPVANSGEQVAQPTPPAPVPETAPAPVEKDLKLSLAHIKSHDQRTDCWTAIDGKVYDVTSAFGKHPGGDDNLAKLCGIDGTELFTTQHGTNAKARSWIDTLQIGTIVQ